MNRHDIISLGHTLEQEENAASDLWTWLPSYKVAQQHHGDYAANFRPSVSDIIKEAAMVFAEQKGYEHSEAERKEWFEKCPCDEGCEQGVASSMAEHRTFNPAVPSSSLGQPIHIYEPDRAASLLQTIEANVDNGKMSDAEFRQFIRNSLPVAQNSSYATPLPVAQKDKS